MIQVSKHNQENPHSDNIHGRCSQILHLPNFIPTRTIEFPKENRPPVQPAKKTGYSIESLLAVAKKERTRFDSQPVDVCPTTPPDSPSALQNYHSRIHETLHRVLQSACYWPNTVPTFHELPNSDKTKLLDEGWAELLVLGLIECNFSLAVLSSYLRNFVYVFKSKEDWQKIEKLEHVLQKLKSLAIDPNEMAFLKAIAVFKPCKSSRPSCSLSTILDNFTSLVQTHFSRIVYH